MSTSPSWREQHALVVRLQTELYEVQLVPGLAAGILGKRSEVDERGADPVEVLAGHGRNI